jgi:oxygen-independent coproporphyrinogen-3 oxidase
MYKHVFPGLYVHVPFCRTKCPYCDFYSETSTTLIPAWLNAVEKEIVQYKDRFTRFDTLYIGGGTPTTLDTTSLTLLMECIFQHFHFEQDSEITLEVNPGDITSEKLQVLHDLGVNRISLGVQSFNDAELALLQRRHSAAEAENALEMIRAYGFENVSVDLIYGIPGQALEAWRATLKKALAFKPEHISCYQLTIAEGTPFGDAEKSGRIKLPDEDESETLFLATAGILEENSYLHYEISNFARGESYLSRHNHKYWNHVPYLGLGPAAHSFLDNNRWWNHRSVEMYCRALEEGYTPVEGQENLSEEQHRLEQIYLGLRTRSGIPMKQLPDTPPVDSVLSALVHDQYLEVVNDRIIPTRKGFLVADRLPLVFM